MIIRNNEGGHLQVNQGKVRGVDEKEREKSGKFMKNCLSLGKMKLLTNFLENVDITCFISIIC